MSHTASTDAGGLFRAGQLTAAVAAANAAVRKRPAELAPRLLLAELLLFAGNLERADVILDACSEIDPAAAVAVAEFRQLVRGEVARRQLFRDGRLPEFLGLPTASQRQALAALVATRAGDAAEAGRLAALAEMERVRPTGHTATATFEDLRDADDIVGGSFEVITTTGKYYWVPMERVTSVTFHPPQRPRDLFWRRATMEVADGPTGEVYLPALYPAPADAAGLTDELRLGRATDWQQASEAAPVRGLGAVTLLVHDDALTMLELDTLTFTVPA